MDIYAYLQAQDEMIDKYLEENYGEIPRFRGARFMKVESPVELGECDNQLYDKEFEVYNKYAGQDVIYIHTRCGDCGMGYEDEHSNYVYCGAKDWEEKFSNLFLEHITEDFDSTYCTHYFKAVINDDYKKILKSLSLEDKGEVE